MDMNRRIVLGGSLAAALAPGCALARDMHFDPMPPLPATPTPGKPGDFDFLSGEWRVHHWFLQQADWIEFDGEATVRGILAGICSIEELRIPARNFNGMGLRLLDVGAHVWSDFWVNARSGVLTTPGQTGSFENGAGIFTSDDEEDGRKVIYAGVWDNITPRGCRWRQASSRDNGQTWAQSWIMHWTRAG